MSEAYTVFPREARFRRERFDNILMTSAAWITKNFLPRHGVGHLSGPSGSFKTFGALDWCMRIVQGLPILDHRTDACGVVYIASEDPNGVRMRVAAWRKRNPEPHGLPFELIGLAPDLRDEEQIEDLIAELRIARDEMSNDGHRLGLVVVDTLATSMPGADENNGVDMSLVLSNLARVGREIGAFVLLVSHTGKDEARGIRGWSGLHSNADCVFMLSREEGSQTTVGRVAKLKSGADGQRFAFSLDKVSLGFDEDDDEITSCVVAYEDAPTAKAKKAKPLTTDETLVLAALEHVTDHGASVPLPSSAKGAQAWMKAVTRSDIKARALASGFADPGDSDANVRQHFSRAFRGLAAAEKVNIEGELVWLIGKVRA